MVTTKLAFQAFADDGFLNPVGQPYPVFLNPESFAHSVRNDYSKPEIIGAATPFARFNGVVNDDLSFSLTLDGSRFIEGQLLEVDKEIDNLHTLLSKYQGKIHSPYYIQVIWGSFRFNGLLTSFNVTYSLFKPTGAPLRAKLDLAFTGFTNAAMREMQAGKRSADLTHRHVVKAGENLPQLCYQLYGDVKYYLQVAQYNSLLNITRLRPGMVLIFPPVR